MGRVDGKVALVTGATRGIGRAVSVRLAEEGAAVVAVDLDGSDDTVKEIRALGGRAVSFVADVRDQAALDAAVAGGVEEFGGLDIVCANAGLFSGIGSTWKLAEDDWSTVIDINLTGVWRTIKAALPPMVERDQGGSLVLMNSVAGMRGVGKTAPYTVAKHGVIGLMRSLVNEVSDKGIRVNTVHPTAVDTPMINNPENYKKMLPHLAEPTREDFEQSFAKYNAMPVAFVQPTDVANAVLWLASDEARYVTGVQLPVDAGYLENV